MRPRSAVPTESLTRRESATVGHLEKLLNADEVDVRELRRVAAVRGLVTSAMRVRVWPLLLQVDMSKQLSFEEYCLLSTEPNDFRTIIATDVHRSMFHFYNATEENERERQRHKLERLLNAVVNHHKGQVHYYQGLHDIATICLLTLDEQLAFAVLCKLTAVRLRDCTQRTLEPVAELLTLQVPILRKLDPELARHLEKTEIPCYFAISWFITWFSHDVPQFHEVCRLFDFFLSTHPMMPLYVGAVGMHAARTDLLKVKEMSELHKALVNLRVVHYLSTDETIIEAISLYSKQPPRKVVRDVPFRLHCCVTPFASLEENEWTVPSMPVQNSGRQVNRMLQTMLGGIVAGSASSGAAMRLVSMAGLGVCALAVLAFKLLENDIGQVQQSVMDRLFD